VEALRRNGKVQDGLYARFKDRVIEIGAYGDIEAFDKLCVEQAAWQAAEAAKAKTAAEAVPADKAGEVPAGAAS
jgi:hypothetical protein